LVGSIGSDVLMSYAVIGETVNLASRPEGANKRYGGRILTTETTVKMAGDALKAREIDRVILVGQNRPQPIFDVMGRRGALMPAQRELRDRYAAGLAAYVTADGRKRAHRLVAVPDDGHSLAMLKPIDTLAARLPADDWDGA